MTMTEEGDPVAAAAEIKRSQSSLELLSNTAAWKNVVETQQQQQQLTLSPYTSSLARVSPAEQISKTNSFASSGDLPKDVGLPFDEGSSVHSTLLFISQAGPGLPLMNNSNSSASLVSSTSSNNLQAQLPSFTSSWHQHLNPSMHAAFTPPRSNLRASRGYYSEPHGQHGFSNYAPPATRSVQDQQNAHHAHLGANGRQGSSDEGEWSYAPAVDSSHLPSDVNKQDEMEALRLENEALKATLKQKDEMIIALTNERDDLQSRVEELRQLPTGKISQIPIKDMMDLMRVYGSETSDTVMPPRKTKIQKASVIRQFRRWNPNFLEFFHYQNGKWEPKLGKEGELKRREELRRQRRVAGPSPAPMPLTSGATTKSRQNNLTEV